MVTCRTPRVLSFIPLWLLNCSNSTTAIALRSLSRPNCLAHVPPRAFPCLRLAPAFSSRAPILYVFVSCNSYLPTRSLTTAHGNWTPPLLAILFPIDCGGYRRGNPLLLFPRQYFWIPLSGFLSLICSSWFFSDGTKPLVGPSQCPQRFLWISGFQATCDGLPPGLRRTPSGGLAFFFFWFLLFSFRVINSQKGVLTCFSLPFFSRALTA